MNKPDVTLSNGRAVIHSPMDNGATHAEMKDGGPINESEWQEYCAIVKQQNADNLRCQELDRIARSKLAFLNRKV